MEKKNSKITISDVANYAGVSKATVSNYLNRRYETMKPETCEKIKQAVKELDYVPSLSARRLSAKAKSKTVCLIIPTNLSGLLSSMYYPVVFDAIGQEAKKQGYSTLIYVRNPDESRESMEYLLGISQSFVDGFIIFDLAQDTRYFKDFEKNGIPYICVGEIDGYAEYNFVASNHGQGVDISMDYLTSLGHRRIALYTEEQGSVVDTVRRRAYRENVKKNNLEFCDDYCFSFEKEDIQESEVVQKIDELLSSEHAPTALLISANLLYYLKRVLREKNLYTPEDLSVIVLEYYGKYSLTYSGFENKEYSRIDSVVSTVAKVAFNKLVDTIEGRNEKNEKYVSYFEPVTLTIGDTTGKSKDFQKRKELTNE